MTVCFIILFCPLAYCTVNVLIIGYIMVDTITVKHCSDYNIWSQCRFVGFARNGRYLDGQKRVTQVHVHCTNSQVQGRLRVGKLWHTVHDARL